MRRNKLSGDTALLHTTLPRVHVVTHHTHHLPAAVSYFSIILYTTCMSFIFTFSSSSVTYLYFPSSFPLSRLSLVSLFVRCS